MHILYIYLYIYFSKYFRGFFSAFSSEQKLIKLNEFSKLRFSIRSAINKEYKNIYYLGFIISKANYSDQMKLTT